ncbi:PLP-dependent aminotransferase family protein [Pseudocolwellia agarivorans]|uniref:MocR-like pyridoxine biosynthesis transcription factor PdxR n=1 Tax=Pseudocolwellia agarivorans TaxID=1911682 RepID=UPI0009857FC3|nr:PLP-dependent aminotransferase family protein [Pseudocolwellia agarivorans]
MAEFLFNFELNTQTSYQNQIREYLIGLIKCNYFGEQPLPSSRKMAKLMRVSRNTVVIVYNSLVEEGYLVSRERSGFYVNEEIKLEKQLELQPNNTNVDEYSTSFAPHWNNLLKRKPANFTRLEKDPEWINYPYPFIYGQIQPEDFPLYQWRECSRQAQGKGSLKHWIEDYIDADDPELVLQICQQVLVRRGIKASPDEVLITLGTQNSLFMLANLLANNETIVGCEDPGYADLRNIFEHAGANIKALQLNDEGVILGTQLKECDYVYVTPSHQYPTTVTMPVHKRTTLLQQAHKDNFVIIEDDYESEVNFIEEPLPALKSLDNHGRVIYVGSISKSLSPGLRIGYVVADKELIRQIRALRRLNYRHPPANNQRTLALFFSQGYYDSHVRRMRKVYKKKWQLMDENIKRYLTTCEVISAPGSFCFWLKLPSSLPSKTLVKEASKKGVLVEAGDSLFMEGYSTHIRLGFSAIQESKIAEGIIILGQIIKGLS